MSTSQPCHVEGSNGLAKRGYEGKQGGVLGRRRMYLLLEFLEFLLLFLPVIFDFFLGFGTGVLDTFRAVFSSVVLAMA